MLLPWVSLYALSRGTNIACSLKQASKLAVDDNYCNCVVTVHQIVAVHQIVTVHNMICVSNALPF